MNYETLLIDQRGGVRVITLNRPDVLNAFNDRLLSELLAAFNEVADDPAVRCVVLTGAGRAFCSGQDLKDIADAPDRVLGERVRNGYNPLIRRMYSIPKPVIAAINGACAGAGMSLALACDLRFASEKAKLIQVFIRIGLVPDSGSSWFMPRLVGYARAFELCTTGRDITAREAAEIGLVNAVLSPELLMKHAMTVAERYASAPTEAIGRIKSMLQRSLDSDLESALVLEAEMQEQAGYSEDYHEGKRAFLEKRPPRFQGK